MARRTKKTNAGREGVTESARDTGQTSDQQLETVTTAAAEHQDGPPATEPSMGDQAVRQAQELADRLEEHKERRIRAIRPGGVDDIGSLAKLKV